MRRFTTLLENILERPALFGSHSLGFWEDHSSYAAAVGVLEEDLIEWGSDCDLSLSALHSFFLFALSRVCIYLINNWFKAAACLWNSFQLKSNSRDRRPLHRARINAVYVCVMYGFWTKVIISLGKGTNAFDLLANEQSALHRAFYTEMHSRAQGLLFHAV